MLNLTKQLAVKCHELGLYSNITLLTKSANPINLVRYVPSNHAIFHFQILAAMAANMVHGSAGYAAGFSAPTMAVIQKDLNSTLISGNDKIVACVCSFRCNF